MKIQACIPAALAAIHNFILKHNPQDNIPDLATSDQSPGQSVDSERVAELRLEGELATERQTLEESAAGATLQDCIADAMWEQYQQILVERAA
ncbi:unnamed protein product [Mycena citricolor]|uniref:Uncharacterized protein n=1 Tax=Mycena citricolor TaxID=2018698 RepID=A0AAD2JVG7_9AGAR|nr:unnamed protein product [Mycena citricolor]